MPDVIEAKGHGGQIEFDGQFVTITRKGFLARSTSGKGEKRIPLYSIAAVQWKPAGPVMNGFIQFTVPGGNEARARFGRQTSSAVQDENSVVFTRQQMPAFEKIRAAIDGAIAASHAPAAAAAAPAPDLGTQIANLSQMHQTGVLSDEEFAAAKSRLISGG
ncbi:MAG TPA: DUF4429 domain-containing protein [Mycobacterium sp.]|jgi:hypothetical protein|uniref:DUF4429 domain-containing protein n=1 Tax=Mycobacterium sp. TaxID=1785 RepID=UPI002F414515